MSIFYTANLPSVVCEVVRVSCSGFLVVSDSVRNYGFDFIQAIMADFMEQSVYMTFVFLPDIHI